MKQNPFRLGALLVGVLLAVVGVSTMPLPSPSGREQAYELLDRLTDEASKLLLESTGPAEAAARRAAESPVAFSRASRVSSPNVDLHGSSSTSSVRSPNDSLFPARFAISPEHPPFSPVNNFRAEEREVPRDAPASLYPNTHFEADARRGRASPRPVPRESPKRWSFWKKN
ncbi:hypothetical protein BCV70DRAFT_199164 [Testicularia cyperi]|uniref:Uncharacterized protein n=1 Tax=Testicularia cyperi TaxID=1882483 RepID=A0A317XVA5_9BASI|nr:hypothetical protein BCV70DRAFT_199164 [Testicularia cyperi]